MLACFPLLDVVLVTSFAVLQCPGPDTLTPLHISLPLCLSRWCRFHRDALLPSTCGTLRSVGPPRVQFTMARTNRTCSTTMLWTLSTHTTHPIRFTFTTLHTWCTPRTSCRPPTLNNSARDPRAGASRDAPSRPCQTVQCATEQHVISRYSDKKGSIGTDAHGLPCVVNSRGCCVHCVADASIQFAQ